MGRESPSQYHFRKKVRDARDTRKWSQAEVAKRLTAKGIDAMYSTTVAKIEAGEREIKLDEAAAMADLFDMSLDELVSRDSRRRREDDLTFYLRAMRDNARRYAAQAAEMSWDVNGDLENVGFGGLAAEIATEWKGISERGDRVKHDLNDVAYALNEMANDASDLLARRPSTGRGEQR